MSAIQRRPGRPTIYTPAILKQICERLSRGEPLTLICRDPRMPGRSTVYRWIDHSRKAAIIRRALIAEGLI